MGAGEDTRSARQRPPRRLVVPSPAVSDCYSVGEIRRAVSGLRAVRRMQSEAPDAEWPRGLAAGFEAFVQRDDRARARISAGQAKRRKLLRRADDLPFTVQEDLFALSGKALASTTPQDLGVTTSYSPGSSRAQQEKVVRDAEAVIQLIRLLLFWAALSARTYPAALRVLLLWLVGPQLVPHLPTWPVSNAPPARAQRPPGRVVRAEPRVARAPGLRRPSLLLCREGRAGPCALGGAL